MKTAIVTGASSGIGKAIADMLVNEGFKVIGFGRAFEEKSSENYAKIQMDMMKTGAFIEKIKEINKVEDIYLLVNCAGVGYYGMHEELNSAKLHEMITVNVELPLTITQLLLRNLKKNKGYVINISSVTAKQTNTYGAAYGATKAAITSFSNSLFEENRKYGLHVAVIHPDMTETKLYRNANFDVADEEDTYLRPEDVADAVKYIIEKPEIMNICELTLRPQRHKIGKAKRNEFV